ncbi:MAG: hypothetical protein Q8Q54_02790 [Methylococcales bacterium]|nr:hypothetical protein [Methylococcales bacterium]MDP3837828.1 hypothetical protein [Methylococcales bacterium]
MLHSFGVNADDVRFVATSATIGDKDNGVLQKYLAGIDIYRVTVIGGKRAIPDLPKNITQNYSASSLPDLQAISDDKTRYYALATHPTSLSLREQFTCDGTPKTLTQLSDTLNTSEQDTLAWLAVKRTATDNMAGHD